MFNLFLKSAFYYTVIKKYGKKLLFILLNIVFIIFIQFIYADIIEILSINKMEDYTIYALLGKWGLILLNFIIMGLILKSILVNKDSTPVPSKEEAVKSKSSFEEEILKKNTLKSKSDLMMEELLSQK